MNEDLRPVRDLLEARTPTPRETFHARNKLTAAMDHHPRRTLRWRLAAAGAAAAAVATFALVQNGPATHLPAAAPPAKAFDARDLLLAAATTAATEEPGRYWHTETVSSYGPIHVQGYNLAQRTVTELW